MRSLGNYPKACADNILLLLGQHGYEIALIRPEKCSWTLTDINGVHWVCTLPPHNPGLDLQHIPMQLATPQSVYAPKN